MRRVSMAVAASPLWRGRADLPKLGRAFVPLSLVERRQGVWGSPTSEPVPTFSLSMTAPHPPSPSPPGRGGADCPASEGPPT
jgi:hypothetical protein